MQVRTAIGTLLALSIAVPGTWALRVDDDVDGEPRGELHGARRRRQEHLPLELRREELPKSHNKNWQSHTVKHADEIKAEAAVAGQAVYDDAKANGWSSRRSIEAAAGAAKDVAHSAGMPFHAVRDIAAAAAKAAFAKKDQVAQAAATAMKEVTGESSKSPLAIAKAVSKAVLTHGGSSYQAVTAAGDAAREVARRDLYEDVEVGVITAKAVQAVKGSPANIATAIGTTAKYIGAANELSHAEMLKLAKHSAKKYARGEKELPFKVVEVVADSVRAAGGSLYEGEAAAGVAAQEMAIEDGCPTPEAAIEAAGQAAAEIARREGLTAHQSPWAIAHAGRRAILAAGGNQTQANEYFDKLEAEAEAREEEAYKKKWAKKTDSSSGTGGDEAECGCEKAKSGGAGKFKRKIAASGKATSAKAAKINYMKEHGVLGASAPEEAAEVAGEEECEAEKARREDEKAFEQDGDLDPSLMPKKGCSADKKGCKKPNCKKPNCKDVVALNKAMKRAEDDKKERLAQAVVSEQAADGDDGDCV